MNKQEKQKIGTPILGKITRGGQTTIPQEIRENLGLEEGSIVEFEQEGSCVRIWRVELTRAKRAKGG